MTRIGIAGRKQALDEAKYNLMHDVVTTFLSRRGFDAQDVEVRSELAAIVGELEGP